MRSLRKNPEEMMAALYLQVSIISQALIFVTRSRSWSYVERPGLLLLGAFMIAQLVIFNLLLKSNEVNTSVSLGSNSDLEKYFSTVSRLESRELLYWLVTPTIA